MNMLTPKRFLLVALSLGLIVSVAGWGNAKATAKANKCVRMALAESLGQELGTDPALSQIGQFGLYNRLMDTNDNLNPIPDLALSWQSNKNATEWTFHLRHGVKFHDGKEFTAKDVVYTYQRLLDPKLLWGGQKIISFLTPLGIIAKDKYTVVFKVAKPNAELPANIITRHTWIVENHATTKTMKNKDAGTGPFMTTNYNPTGSSWTIVKNPNYWETGLPKADCVTYRIIPEPGATTAALRTGQIDIVQSVSFASLPELQSDKNVKLLAAPPGLSATLAMWVDTPPFNDVRVRRAMKKVVDRKAMGQTVFRGYAVPAVDNPTFLSSPYSWTKTAPAQDIPGAKALLAAAGYNAQHPLKVDLYTADAVPNMINWAQAYAQMAAKAGIQVNVIVSSPNDYWDVTWRHQPFATSAWNPRLPSEAYGLEYFDTRSVDPAGNDSHWYRPDWEAIVRKARATIDPAARAKLYQQAGKIISQDGGVIIPVFVRNIAGVRANCTGYRPHAFFSRIDMRYVVCK